MEVEYSGRNENLKKAAEFVPTLFADEQFWKAIVEHGNYDWAGILPPEIADRLRGGPKTIYMRDFTPRWPWNKFRYRNTVAKVEGSNPPRFGYHTKARFAKRSVGQMVNTIVHEYVHLADNTDGVRGEQMGHNGNRAGGKERTAPYAIGAMAQRIYEASRGEPSHELPDGEM